MISIRFLSLIPPLLLIQGVMAFSPASDRQLSEPSSILLAQADRNFRVEFEPGTSSTSVRNSVVRGTRDRYVLEAQAGQTMTVDLTSLENNAVFDVVNRSTNSSLVQESTAWSGTLPTNGNYEIVVGGTRGNATYELTVGIE